MRKLLGLCCGLVLGLTLTPGASLAFADPPPSAPAAAPAPSEQLVSFFAAQRETLLSDGKVNLPEMSSALRATVIEAERLTQAGDLAGAGAKLDELQKYGPLQDIPSADVLMLASYLALKRGDTAGQQALQGRANAVRELLWHRIGSGTQSDPIRVIMVNEIIEWTRTRMGRITENKPVTAEGRALQSVTYSGPDTGNQPRTIFFFLDPRYMAMIKPPGLFTPVPQMTPEMQKVVASAKEKRSQFLDDMSIPYLRLQTLIHDKLKQSVELDTAGKPQEAIAALREIETIRKIEDIPTPTLLIRYSTLLGKTGEAAKQNEIRPLAFGVLQAMAASGDALTQDTAIEVMFVEEEYAWLNDKHLTRLQQSLIQTPHGMMDMLHTKDPAGNERDYYFNIARLQKKEMQSIANHE